MEKRDSRVSTASPKDKEWWRVFDDPTLTRLIDTAYEQNLQLQIAGVRVLQARAQLGITIGQWYPQTQQGFGSLTQYGIGSGIGSAGTSGGSAAGSAQSSQSSVASAGGKSFSYKESQLGATASWEIDFWGKFRRAIESAQMSLLASIADYDSTLVSLTADVASNYVLIRTLEKQLRIARENSKIQEESLRIAQVRFDTGATSDRDVQQALSLLNSTQATIPQLESNLRTTANALSTLLGIPPAGLDGMISGSAVIPSAPAKVAVGIPIDLLRRRPDIRSAEYQAAAQCAQIGVAKGDLYPAFSLSGTFQVLATNLGNASLSDMFSWNNRLYSYGPSYSWNIFNYGRITNNVRLQDARFQELLVNYRNVVLTAQQEVEDGLITFLKAQDRVVFLGRAADAAKRSVDLAMVQYREGATDYTTVLTAQQALLTLQNNLAISRGNVSQGLIAIYRALGGGWQIREGKDFVPAEMRKEMAERTNWNDLLEEKAVQPSTLKRPEILPPLPDW